MTVIRCPLTLLLTLGLGACQAERHTTPPRPDLGTPRYRPPANTRLVMKEFRGLVEELRRRVARLPMSGPAQRLADITINLPDAVAADRAAVKARALALVGSQQPARDFNALIDACQPCHRTNSRRAYDQVQRYHFALAPQRIAPPRKK